MRKRVNIQLFPLIILLFSFNVFANSSLETPQQEHNESKKLSTEQGTLKQADQLWADKKIDSAITAYKEIIAKQPDNRLVYQRLASLYLLNNRAKDAVPAYQDAIIHDPTNPKLFASMSIAYLHLGKYAMAKAMANEAITLDPKMENAKKIISYAEKKVEVLEQVGTSTQANMPLHDAAFLKKEMAKRSESTQTIRDR